MREITTLTEFFQKEESAVLQVIHVELSTICRRSFVWNLQTVLDDGKKENIFVESRAENTKPRSWIRWMVSILRLRTFRKDFIRSLLRPFPECSRRVRF